MVKDDNTRGGPQHHHAESSKATRCSVDNGLEPGEKVVIDGIDKLQQGTKVNVRMVGGRGQKTQLGGRHEPVPAIYSAAGGDVPADGADCCWWAVAYKQLPVSALPQVDYPTIQVMTFYPGASPDVMASSVTAPLERQFGQVPGLNQMTSTSSSGCSDITLQFALDLNIDVAEQQVQAAINAAATFLPTRTCPIRRFTARPIRPTRRSSRWR